MVPWDYDFNQDVEKGGQFLRFDGTLSIVLLEILMRLQCKECFPFRSGPRMILLTSKSHWPGCQLGCVGTTSFSFHVRCVLKVMLPSDMLD